MIVSYMQLKKKKKSNFTLLNNILWQNLYDLGARKIGVTTLPPIGCLPAAITIFGSDTNKCVARLNHDAVSFNTKLNATSLRLQKKLSGLNLVVFDIYQTLFDLVTKPTDNGTWITPLNLGLLCNISSPTP